MHEFMEFWFEFKARQLRHFIEMHSIILEILSRQKSDIFFLSTYLVSMYRAVQFKYIIYNQSTVLTCGQALTDNLEISHISSPGSAFY